MLTKPLFIVSGILFIVESVPPACAAHHVLNPLVQAIALVAGRLLRLLRSLLRLLSPTCSAVAGSLFVIGAYLLRRHASWLIEN